jgi:hypothetical protein
MEVHHHAHSSPATGGTERKKWTHYIWEFLMLFLAVFCGFLAENIREHQIEIKREKEYVRSMIEDLKEDTAYFNSVITANAQVSEKIDTLIRLLKGDNRKASAKKIYYLARGIPLNDANLTCQNKTFEQLKGSGGLRLIHNAETQIRIGTYYQINKWIETNASPMEYQNRRDLFLSYDELFDAEIMQEMMKTFLSGSVNIEDSRFTLLTNNPTIINKFCFRYHFIYSAKKVVAARAKGFMEKATALIVYLKKEYHLK